MRDLLFPSSPVHRGALAESARLQAKAFVMECRAIAGMYETADPADVDFVHGDVAGTLHLAPRTAQAKAATAVEVMAHPRLVAALDQGRLGVGHAMAVLGEVSHLPSELADQVLAQVLGQDDEPVASTAGELRAAVKNAAIELDAAAARRRHEQAKRDRTGVRGRPTTDGMAQVTIDCTATDAATIVAAVSNRVGVQAVLECPVERVVDLHAVASSGVWGVDVRMPVAVALGLSDHPAVLAVERPVRAKSWQAGDEQPATALRDELVRMATSPGLIPDLTTDGYVPTEALGRLVDLRDVTSVFPGDATSARRTDRDHRLPYPLGPTSEWNLQNLTRRWHRAKTTSWHTRQLADGSIRWTSPSNGVYPQADTHDPAEDPTRHDPAPGPRCRTSASSRHQLTPLQPGGTGIPGGYCAAVMADSARLDGPRKRG